MDKEVELEDLSKCPLSKSGLCDNINLHEKGCVYCILYLLGPDDYYNGIILKGDKYEY